MKEESNLDYFGEDPGAVIFGNFINYYSFHNVEQRTANLHPDMFPASGDNGIICLDIGCNTGNLTQEVYLYLKRIYPGTTINILAVDIDPKLIARAEESTTSMDITFMSANVMVNADREIIINYLKSFNRSQFNITFCFSVTMWIHLNNGDDGLLEFLKYLKEISKILIIEPQPWNCYRNAQRRIKKSGSTFKMYPLLKLRSNVDVLIENILIENGFIKIYESSHSSWHRKIQSYSQT